MNVTENALDQSRAHSTNHTNIGSRGSARWLPAAGGAEDRINIELVSSSEHRLPKKEPSSTSIGTCVREEAEDRINILEFERERQAQRAATPATHLLDAENAQPAVTLCQCHSSKEGESRDDTTTCQCNSSFPSPSISSLLGAEVQGIVALHETHRCLEMVVSL